MLRVEKQMGQPIENLLPQMINEHGVKETGRQLGVSTATVGYWMLKMGIEIRRIAVAPEEAVIVTRSA